MHFHYSCGLFGYCIGVKIGFDDIKEYLLKSPKNITSIKNIAGVCYIIAYGCTFSVFGVMVGNLLTTLLK